MKSFSSVIGLGFGDEGKGLTVNSLCSQTRSPMVIRHSGGQQAGHTVIVDKIKHTFSNFGSGTLQGAPTYWDKYCTFSPTSMLNEYHILRCKGVRPKLYVHRNCPVTTPYDKWANRDSKKDMANGTCGSGVGQTHQRQSDHYSLVAGDLEFPNILEEKLKLISDYYDTAMDRNFLETCREVIPKIGIVDRLPEGYNYIYESSQGLMLDKDIGFFPHVTRSNVGTKNIIKENLRVFMVTRAFQTRHGNGPMTNESMGFQPRLNEHEINVTNKYQGAFRQSMLDLDLLRYAISRDDYLRETEDKELVITCLDLMKEWKYTIKGQVITHDCEDDFILGICKYLEVKKVHRVRSPDGHIGV